MRKADIKRKTNEVDIKGKFNIDGEGRARINTNIEPLNHLLTLFAFHGLFDLEIDSTGDLQHHVIEDIGIALGKALKEALGDKCGINRYGCFSVVMDEVVVEVDVDISGRPVLHRQVEQNIKNAVEEVLSNDKFDDTNFTFRDISDFLEAFVQHSGISLVYIIKSGKGDLHHLLEAFFKALGKALDEAAQLDPRRKGVPSTKGIID